MYVCMQISIASRSLFEIYRHGCMHAHARAARKTHPSHMLTSLLPQYGKTPSQYGRYNDEVKTAFAEHAAKSG